MLLASSKRWRGLNPRVHNYVNIPNFFEVTAHSYYEAGYIA